MFSSRPHWVNNAIAARLLGGSAQLSAKADPLNQGRTALHVAATREIAKLLLERGADPRVKDSNGDLPIHRAAARGAKGVVEVLLAAGTPVDVPGARGRTLLIDAAGSENIALTELLIQGGADVNAGDCQHQTALHEAAWIGNSGVLKCLIDAGADIEAPGHGGSRPLHYAAMGGDTGGHVESVKLLLAAGATPDAEDDNGEMPSSFAERNRNRRVLREIEPEAQ